jgi:peptidyl-prolyl cis-trans isomerase SurA
MTGHFSSSLAERTKASPGDRPHARASAPAILFLLFAFILTVISPRPTQAQSQLAIAATVNDQMISMLDVEARVALSINLAELPDTPDTRRRLVGQVLRSIIDEKLRLQEAKSKEITVSRREIERAEKDFERRAGLQPGGLRAIFRKLGLDSSSFVERLESQIAWGKLVSRRYMPTIDIGDKEIDDYLADIERNKGKPEFLVSEIFLPTGAKQNLDQVRALANRLMQQINQGANFSAVARNFSQSATAAGGGNLGWHSAGQLPREIDAVIGRMAPGQIAGPVEMPEGIYILRLENRRAIDPFRENAPERPDTVTLHQAHYPLPEGAANSLVTATMARANDLIAGSTSCDAFDALAKQTDSPLSGALGTFPVNQLSSQLQSIVANLPVGRPSAPTPTADGIIVVMVCHRAEAHKQKVMTPAERRDEVRERLIDERLNLAAKQYLRNLRRTAIVDIRL